jgi:hypothetical protein
MLGVHGNGLSHLLFMKPSRVSAVIEMFFPGGFAHDYHWTSRALGMDHYAVWNDKYDRVCFLIYCAMLTELVCFITSGITRSPMNLA